nr:hypothetical protein [uncultured Ruminococcus sp.]
MRVNICDIPKDKKFSDYPDDTTFVLTESFPHYILDPFETIYPDDPRYESALTYEEVKKKIN